MKVIIACEESQVVCKAFREKGHEAYSCDTLPCSGGHPEWHIKGDIRNVLNSSFMAFGQFWTEAETVDRINSWDLMIAFPPCTYLTVTGNKWFKPEFKDRFPDRERQRQEAIKFFMDLYLADIEKIAIENPIGIMSTELRKPDQIINPYYFGDEARKSTCLWLKGLPKLVHIKESDLFDKKTHVSQGKITTYKSGKTCAKWYADAIKLTPQERMKVRSQTFQGIANAFANQWG